MVYPANLEEKTGFIQIRDLVKNHCLSNLGHQKVDEMVFSSDYETICRLTGETEEFRQICLEDEDFPVDHYYDIRECLERIKVEGSYFDVTELFDLRRSLDSIKSILRFLKNTPDENYPYLRQLAAEVMLYPFITEKIDRIINKNGVIKDNASKELQNIRRQEIVLQSTVSKKIHQLLRKAQEAGWVEEDATLSVRDGKMTIPVSTTHKRKIKGIVQDESTTGKTSYIEPYEVVEHNNQIRELEIAEKREIKKILVDCTDNIRPYREELREAYDFMAQIDFIRAKARFSLRINAILPKISNKPSFHWQRAIHPLLFHNFQKENKQVVPLDIYLNEIDSIILISGPNAGGKSVCLKTVGIIQYMLQCGMLIPVNETSEAGIFSDIFIDIGDEQSIENDLSTYSSHLLNMKYFIEHASDETLVLIDEFGTGTEPHLGASIAESILDKLNKIRVKGVITTHYTNLKHYATSTKGIINGAMLFDSNEMKPLYQLKIGQPGSSFAFEIAGNIGLPNEILDKAKDIIGQDYINFDKHLKAIEADRQFLENQKKNINQKEYELQKTIEKYNNEIDFSIKQRQNILSLAREQAKDILTTTNKQIENTIFEIRKSNAEKEVTKEARRKLDEYKQQFEEKHKIEEKKIEEKIVKIEKEKKQIAYKLQPEKKKEKLVVESARLHIGDFVKIKGGNAIGEIIELDRITATIAIGQMKTVLKRIRLEKLPPEKQKELKKKPQKKRNYISEDVSEKKMNFNSCIDIRGQRGDEALQTIMDYIDDAIVVEVSEVRILHGTGNGILKKLIRDYLRTVDVVKQVKDEMIQLGGAGISVVTLDY